MNPPDRSPADEVSVVRSRGLPGWIWLLAGLWLVLTAERIARGHWRSAVFSGIAAAVVLASAVRWPRHELLVLSAGELRFNFGARGSLPWALLGEAHLGRYWRRAFVVIPFADLSQVTVTQRYRFPKQKPLTEIRLPARALDRPAEQLVSELEQFRCQAAGV